MLTRIAGSLVFVSLFSAAGALLLFLSDDRYRAVAPYLVSLSAGTIFGGVFIHLIFRLSNAFAYTRLTGLLVIVGVLGSLVLERLVHWHCHHAETHQEPLPYVLATGDAFHNLIDGVLIATSFLASTTAGFGIVIAVIAHKIPKEFGDFGVMVEYGFSKPKAVMTNIVVSLFMFVGAGGVILLSGVSAATVPFLLPVVIGNFLYVAGSDLLPAFKDDDQWLFHLLVFAAGVAVMYGIPYLRSVLGM